MSDLSIQNIFYLKKNLLFNSLKYKQGYSEIIWIVLVLELVLGLVLVLVSSIEKSGSENQNELIKLKFD